MKGKLKQMLASCYQAENRLVMKKWWDLLENLVAASMCVAINKQELSRPGEWVVCTGSKNHERRESLAVRGFKGTGQQTAISANRGGVPCIAKQGVAFGNC